MSPVKYSVIASDFSLCAGETYADKCFRYACIIQLFEFRDFFFTLFPQQLRISRSCVGFLHSLKSEREKKNRINMIYNITLRSKSIKFTANKIKPFSFSDFSRRRASSVVLNARW